MSMFGALNRFISRLDADGPQANSGPAKGACGFQVLRNKNSDIPLEPWYDFIVGINGRPIDNPNSQLFAQEVRNCAGGAVSLTIWSAKGQRSHTVSLPIPSHAPSLGLTLQWTALSSTSDVWHILDIIPGSPADQAGLLPYGDYILGSPEGQLRGEPGLGELVEDHLQRPLRLWVYNNEYAVTRTVTITPSRSWGGEGALGCVLGFGALHQLPPSLAEPPAAPGDTLFEGEAVERFSNEQPSEPAPADAQSGNFLVPAAMSAPPPMGGAAQRASPGPGARKKGRTGGRSPSGFEDMWEEGASKSKETDDAPRAKDTPPPPPKAGVGPPPDGAEVGEAATGAPGGLTPPLQERTQTRSPDPIVDEDD